MLSLVFCYFRIPLFSDITPAITDPKKQRDEGALLFGVRVYTLPAFFIGRYKTWCSFQPLEYLHVPLMTQ